MPRKKKAKVSAGKTVVDEILTHPDKDDPGQAAGDFEKLEKSASQGYIDPVEYDSERLPGKPEE